MRLHGCESKNESLVFVAGGGARLTKVKNKASTRYLKKAQRNPNPSKWISSRSCLSHLPMLRRACRAGACQWRTYGIVTKPLNLPPTLVGQHFDKSPQLLGETPVVTSWLAACCLSSPPAVRLFCLDQTIKIVSINSQHGVLNHPRRGHTNPRFVIHFHVHAFKFTSSSLSILNTGLCCSRQPSTPSNTLKSEYGRIHDHDRLLLAVHDPEAQEDVLVQHPPRCGCLLSTTERPVLVRRWHQRQPKHRDFVELEHSAPQRQQQPSHQSRAPVSRPGSGRSRQRQRRLGWSGR